MNQTRKQDEPGESRAELVRGGETVRERRLHDERIRGDALNQSTLFANACYVSWVLLNLSLSPAGTSGGEGIETTRLSVGEVGEGEG